MTAAEVLDGARTALARARRVRLAVWPWLRLAAAGQARLWKWPLLIAIRVPAVAAALAGAHLLLAVLLWTLVSPIPTPLPPLAELLVCLAVVVVAVGVVAGGPLPAPPDHRWWSEAQLVGALLAAGVLPRPGKDEDPPMLHRLGQPQHDHRGTAVTLALPAGRTAADCIAAHARLSGSLGIPPDRLRVAHVEGKPANVVRLAELAPRRTGTTPAEVGTLARTAWAQPVRIGEQEDGTPVTLATHEANLLLAGIPGSGKTSTARIVLAHYLLDPEALVFGLEGKGSRRDYGAAVPMCAGWVWGTDETAAEALGEMLRQVLAIVRDRNSADSEPEGGWPGLLLLLEELQDVRAGCDKAGRERLDNTLGRIVRMGRAVGVSVLVSTQRPSVEDVPAGVRNLVSQRLALQLRNGADAQLVLGVVPDLPLPTRRGEALLTTPTGTRAVHLDYLSDGDWTAVCARAVSLRGDTTGEAGPDRSEAYSPAVSLVKQRPAEPLTALLAACADVISAAGPEGVGATALHTLLGTDVRPGSTVQLGKALGARPDVFVQRREMPAGHRRWHLSDDLSASVGDLSGAARERPRTCQDSTEKARMWATPPLPSDPLDLDPTAQPNRPALQHRHLQRELNHARPNSRDSQPASERKAPQAQPSA